MKKTQKTYQREYANDTAVIVNGELRYIVDFRPETGKYELLNWETGVIGFRSAGQFVVA